MMSPTFTSMARPIAPLGCRRAKSCALNPRASITAIARASPITSVAVVLDVGARLNGHASFGTRQPRTASACVANVDFGAPVNAMIPTPNRLIAGSRWMSSSDSPE